MELKPPVQRRDPAGTLREGRPLDASELAVHPDQARDCQ